MKLLILSIFIGLIIYYNAYPGHFVNGFLQPVGIISLANPYFSIIIVTVILYFIAWMYRPKQMIVTVTEL